MIDVFFTKLRTEPRERRALCERLEHQLPRRVIMDLDGVSPYLTRTYLHGAPTMPDLSSPFDEYGQEREGAVWPLGPGLYLHRIHRNDNDRELHNHPWAWAASWILAGGYVEERRHGVPGDYSIVTRELRPGDSNTIGHGDFHRVTRLLDGECWTLFAAGPKVSSWGFWSAETDTVTPWREFMAAKRAALGIAP